MITCSLSSKSPSTLILSTAEEARRQKRSDLTEMMLLLLLDLVMQLTALCTTGPAIDEYLTAIIVDWDELRAIFLFPKFNRASVPMKTKMTVLIDPVKNGVLTHDLLFYLRVELLPVYEFRLLFWHKK